MWKNLSISLVFFVLLGCWLEPPPDPEGRNIIEVSNETAEAIHVEWKRSSDSLLEDFSIEANGVKWVGDGWPPGTSLQHELTIKKLDGTILATPLPNYLAEDWTLRDYKQYDNIWTYHFQGIP